MSGWQPIETAPKDGTLVLLFTKRKEYSRVQIGSFREDDFVPGEPMFFADDYDDFSTGYCSTPLDDATHWMPLPEHPPSERGSGD
jgi:hypothetical protein